MRLASELSRRCDGRTQNCSKIGTCKSASAKVSTQASGRYGLLSTWTAIGTGFCGAQDPMASISQRGTTGSSTAICWKHDTVASTQLFSSLQLSRTTIELNFIRACSLAFSLHQPFVYHFELQLCIPAQSRGRSFGSQHERNEDPQSPQSGSIYKTALTPWCIFRQ